MDADDVGRWQRVVACLVGALLLGGCFDAGLENRVVAKPPADTADVPAAIRPSDYVGTWRSPADGGLKESEWGPTRSELTFRGDGILELVVEIVNSPGGDGTIRDSGKYEIKNNQLISKVLSRKEPCDIRMEKGLLVLTIGKGERAEVYRYRRVRVAGN